jgi:spermidine/putrescine transport system ATP-binding protein
VSRGEIELLTLVKHYGDVLAVAGIEQQMPGGEFFTLLGPSGCGKTTTLRLIAGFEKLDSGAILIDGVDVSGRPPHKRPVNTVFQSYALFPHMTVADNVAFGLRYQRLSKGERARRVGEAMSMVQLSGLEARRPGQLSGGQQQRVALARALVLEPPVLLLDEPLGALDARLRVDLQVELKRIQETLGITFVYVTHDQDEALTMSDRVAVMRGGRIEQCGTPRVLYEEPETAFVANFLGASNLIPGRVDAGGRLALGDFALRAETLFGAAGEEAIAMIRPERVKLEPHGSTEENRVPGMVEQVVYLGFHQELRVRLASGALVRVDVPNDGDAPEREQGDPVAVHLPAECLRVLRGEAGDAPVGRSPESEAE